MINLFRLLCTISFCSVLISSCKKDKDSKKDVEPVTPCDRIVKVAFYNYQGVVPNNTVEYDEQGRVKFVKGEELNASSYTYLKDKIVLAATDIRGNDIGLTYYLDANGRVKGTSYFDNQFTYNSEGYLVSFRQPYTVNGSTVTGYDTYTLTYKNGDLDEVYTLAPNVSSKKVNFKYYDEPNQILLGYNQPLYAGAVLGDRNSFFLISAGFFGRQSAHLYRTLAINGQWSNGEIKYQKDAKGRITSTGAFAFDYQCP